MTLKYFVPLLWLEVLPSRFSTDREWQEEFASFFKLQSPSLQRPCNFSLKIRAPPSGKKNASLGVSQNTTFGSLQTTALFSYHTSRSQRDSITTSAKWNDELGTPLGWYPGQLHQDILCQTAEFTADQTQAKDSFSL